MRRNTVIRGPLLYANVRQILNGAKPVSERIRHDPKCRLSAKSLEDYGVAWKQLQDRFPGKRINEFTRDDVDEFFTSDAYGARRKLSPSQANRYCNAFRYAFRWAAKADLLDGKPSPALELREDWGQTEPKFKIDAVWLDLGQVDLLVDLDGCGEDPIELRNRVLLQVIVGTGLRCFEAAALRWGHLMGRGDRIRLQIPHGKGDKARVVAPTLRTRQVLETWRTAMEGLQGHPVTADQPVFPALQRPAGRLFLWDQGLGTDGIRHVVAVAGRRIGEPHLRPHDLRRTHAGLLQDSEATLDEIKEQLGHESLATTERYLKGRGQQIDDRLRGANF